MDLCSNDLANRNRTTRNGKVWSRKGTFKDRQFLGLCKSQEVSRVKNLNIDIWEAGRIFHGNSNFDGQGGGRLLMVNSHDRSGRGGTVSFFKAGRITEMEGKCTPMYMRIMASEPWQT